MFTVPTLRSAMPRRFAGLVIAALLGLGMAVNPATAQHADAAVSASVGVKAVKVAASVAGVKYKMGGTTPKTGFDCSGLTGYVFAKVGKKIPRTAQAQYNASYKIKKRYARAGDLVFFFSGKNVYHVAIYAGNGYIWHSPKPGKKVSKVKLWTSAVKYGRVR